MRTTQKMVIPLIDSPLGDQAEIYLKKEAKNGHIQLHPERELLELYPVGWTKRTAGVELRQNFYRRLYKKAVEFGTEESEYPFLPDTHEITFLPLTDNEHDPYCLEIIFKADEESPLSHLTDSSMGYVPKRISQQLRANLSMINGATILKVKENVYGKYYGAKIMLAYGEADFNPAYEDVGRFIHMILD